MVSVHFVERKYMADMPCVFCFGSLVDETLLYIV